MSRHSPPFENPVCGVDFCVARMCEEVIERGGIGGRGWRHGERFLDSSKFRELTHLEDRKGYLKGAVNKPHQEGGSNDSTSPPSGPTLQLAPLKGPKTLQPYLGWDMVGGK